jgi:hypothetical protein
MEDKTWKTRFIPLLEYYLFPEFRKKTYLIKKFLRWTAIFIAVYFFGAISVNNFVLLETIEDKDSELHNSYTEISNLYHDAKSVVFDECLDSLKNSDDYIRFTIYNKSGIMVPENVPDNHLTAIKNNAEKMGIPLSIYVRVINHESRFDSSATNSSSGAMGYMQLMPGTFRHFYDVLSLRGGNTALNNLMCGSRLLKQNYDYWYKRKNNQEEAWQMALACYAMGDSLPRALGRVPESVKGYVNYVMQNENF